MHVVISMFVISTVQYHMKADKQKKKNPVFSHHVMITRTKTTLEVFIYVSF